MSRSKSPIRALAAALAAGAAVAAAAAPAAADAVVLGAAADNTLFFSPDGSLSNGAGQHFFAGTNAGAAPRRGLLAFDIASAIPAGATVTGVTLTLNMSRGDPGAAEVSIHRLLAPWGEGSSVAPGNEGGGGSATPGSATWLHRFYPDVLWASPGGDFDLAASAAAPIGGLGEYSWSSPAMAADVQLWLDDGAANFGWVLIGDESIDSTAKRFDSRENAVESFRPRLTVEYIPSPGAGAAPALAALAGARRRRRLSPMSCP